MNADRDAHPSTGKLQERPSPTQVEVEFTNRCNAQCVACPRTHMPRFGYMAPDTLTAILEKYAQYTNSITGSPVRLVVAGGGEPLLHPQALNLLEQCRSSGLEVTLITNASRFHAVDLQSILECVDRVLVSFWGIERGEYSAAMKLDFDASLRNVEHAVALANRLQVPLSIQWVRVLEVTSDAMSIRRFWAERGVDDVRGGDVLWNRAGALQNVDGELERSESLPPDGKRRVWCADLYFSDSYSWSGDLLLCCCDFFDAGHQPLGHVSTLSLDEIATIKRDLLARAPSRRCSACRLPRRQRPLQLAGDVVRALGGEEQRMLLYR